MSELTTPEEAIEMYLTARRTDGLADSTLYTHEKRLRKFVEWCDETGVEAMEDVDGLSVHKYKNWKSKGIKPVTLKSYIDTLRVFIRFCERIELVDDGLAEKIDSIALSREQNRSETTIDAERAQHAIEYMGRWEYCSRQHVTVTLLWRLGCRLGALRALDLQDVDLQERFVEFKHRPETGTPLKNKKAGERTAAITRDTAELLRDWISEKRPDMECEHGRDALLTTQNGRISRQCIRRTTYAKTRPCELGQGCPHGRSPDDCRATEHSRAYECPSSVSPHPFRRGAITHWLTKGVDQPVVSGRMDVTADVIEQHYDSRSEREKMEARRQFLDAVK